MRRTKSTDTDIGKAVAAFLRLVEVEMVDAGIDTSGNAAIEVFGKRNTNRQLRFISAPEFSNLRTGNWSKGNKLEVLNHIKDGLNGYRCTIGGLENWWNSDEGVRAKVILTEVIGKEIESFISNSRQAANEQIYIKEGASGELSSVISKCELSHPNITTNKIEASSSITQIVSDRPFMDVSELLYADADWRQTNLAPGEGQWLQLLLRFGQGYVRDRDENLTLDTQVHRVHVVINFDGGRAKPRDESIERSDSNGNKLIVKPTIAWLDERAEFSIDNPVSNTPLTGRYDWFDVCEVDGTVGQNGSLEISATKCGITVSIPPEIKEQIDPERAREYEVPEERLIEAWLRERAVPKSRLSDAGRFRLANIPLRRRTP